MCVCVCVCVCTLCLLKKVWVSLIGGHAPRVFSFLDKDIKICRRRHGWKHEEYPLGRVVVLLW